MKSPNTYLSVGVFLCINLAIYFEEIDGDVYIKKIKFAFIKLHN